MLRRHSLFLTFCLLFASFSSPIDNCVNGGIGKRSLDPDEVDFIKSLAEQLYKSKAYRDSVEEKLEKLGIIVEPEEKKREDIQHGVVDEEVGEKKREDIQHGVVDGAVEKKRDAVQHGGVDEEVGEKKREDIQHGSVDGAVEKKRDAIQHGGVDAEVGQKKRENVKRGEGDVKRGEVKGEAEEKRRNNVKRDEVDGEVEEVKKEGNNGKDGELVQRDSADDPASGGSNNGGPTPTPTPNKDVVIAPLIADGGWMDGKSRTYLIIMISACCVFGVIALIGASACYYNVKTQKEKTREIPYMSSPVYEYKTIPSAKNYSGHDTSYGSYPTDNALALSAQKFHFQHEKEKLIAMENEKSQTEPVSTLSVDYTDEVFETPGLAGMWDVEVDCPVYSGEVTPGTTPRDHTPMMRRPIESSEEEGEEQEDEEEEREKEEEGGTTNGAFINGDATEHPHVTNGPKSLVNGFNGTEDNEDPNHNNSINKNNIDRNETNVNGTNGYH